LGPNGAGKTTLVEILATLLLPSSGRALVCGRDVLRDAAAVRKVVSYCASASENFYPRLSAFKNLEFFAILNNLPPREAREKVRFSMPSVCCQRPMSIRAPFTAIWASRTGMVSLPSALALASSSACSACASRLAWRACTVALKLAQSSLNFSTPLRVTRTYSPLNRLCTGWGITPRS